MNPQITSSKDFDLDVSALGNLLELLPVFQSLFDVVVSGAEDPEPSFCQTLPLRKHHKLCQERSPDQLLVEGRGKLRRGFGSRVGSLDKPESASGDISRWKSTDH